MTGRFFRLLLAAALCLSVACAEPVLPESYDSFSSETAAFLLSVSSGHTASGTAAQLESEGFTVLMQRHYDKADADPGHTCAFTLARKAGEDGPAVYLLVIRGTNAGEWYSNFDFAPSHDSGTRFAENFLYCAQDVLLCVEDALEEDPEAVWLVTGHSRGAACANLFGLMLNAVRSPELNYICTSATPRTLRGDTPGEDSNIFNLINPLDIVPMMPLEAWGYRRAGTDIALPADPERAEKLGREIGVLARVSPDIGDYYGARHLLTAPGTGEDGLTVFEVMTLFASSLAGMRVDGTVPGLREDVRMPDAVSEDSDLAPLLERLESLGGKGGFERLLEQHMPDIYAALLRQASGGPEGE